MKKIFNKSFWRKVIPAIVVIAVVAVFFAVFIMNTNKRVSQQNSAYVADAIDQTADRIADDMLTAVRTLSNISEICSPNTDKSTYPDDLKKIDNAIFSMVDYVAAESEDGGYYYGTLYGFRGEAAATDKEPVEIVKVTTNPDGKGEYVYSQSFALGMETRRGQAGMLEEFSNVTGVDDNMMSFYTGLRDTENDKNIGVLIGRYNEEKMKSILDASFFGKKSGVYLCKANGDVITATDESFLQNEELTNILESLKTSSTDKSYGKIEKSFLEGKKLTFSFKTDGGTAHACFKQIPLQEDLSADEWMIVQTFPASVTAEMIRVVNLEGLQLGLGLVLALVLYIGLLLLIHYWQNKKLVTDNRDKSYVVDGLTQLYDRFVYVNLDERKYRYIADTNAANSNLADEGDYNAFKDNIVASFKDSYDKKRLAPKLTVEQIREDMGVDTAEIRYEYRTFSDTAKSKWEDLSIISLSRNEQGQVKEVLFARQNISSLKEIERQNQAALKDALKAAEDANSAKSSFLSNMSHDIRTPMNAVMGFSTLLEHNADDPEKVLDYTRKIKSSGQHLLGLINDILDMSKIESGKFTLNNSEFELSELLDEINSVIAPQAKEKSQKFNMRTQNLVHETYIGDRLRISQILINVLSNAVKYTPEGGNIEFIISLAPRVLENYDNLSFVTSDNGIGMSEEFLKRLYEPFERADDSLTAKIQGTGLGMAITKNLVNLMGGTIDVKSKPGAGTTFSINLQVRAVEEREHKSVAQTVETENPLKGMNFLVAEDNDINAEIIKELLEISGASCVLAENGKIAVSKFELSADNEFDMILMDVQMPVMNGYEATRAIRSGKHPRAKTIPIAAMTANAFADDVKKALESGMNVHIAKPIALDVLKAAVKTLKSNK